MFVCLKMSHKTAITNKSAIFDRLNFPRNIKSKQNIENCLSCAGGLRVQKPKGGRKTESIDKINILRTE